jgi:hypothetical protein
MSKLAVVIASHDEAGKLERLVQWIPHQKEWAGPLIVVYSGEFISSSLVDICKENNVQLVLEEFQLCGLAKRNRGAEIARELNAEYVTFLTDYQSLAPGSIKGFEKEEHSESLIFGNVQFDLNSKITIPKISQFEFPLTSSSSYKGIWAIFSSVSESGVLVKLDTFQNLGSWQYPVVKKKVFLGGDGIYLVARAFVNGSSFGYSRSYQVLGGHKNLNITREIQEARGSLYPYAFTLATKVRGLPRWIGLRFILGRIARVLQMVLRGDLHGAIDTRIEIGARCRAYLGIRPSLKAKPLQANLDYNCKKSDFSCNSKRTTACRNLG